jgi:hypothetical protein
VWLDADRHCRQGDIAGTIKHFQPHRHPPTPNMPLQVVNGLLTLAIFLIPAPLLPWTDHPRRRTCPPARATSEV